MKKKCYDSNNARNRDSFTFTKSQGMLRDFSHVPEFGKRSSNLDETENVLIDYLDEKYKQERAVLSGEEVLEDVVSTNKTSKT